MSKSSEDVWRIVRDGSGWPPLWCAAVSGDRDAAARELEAGADPNAVGDQGTTPLHVAALYGHHEVVEVLLKAGADPNRTDPHGNGPLWTAVFQACLLSRTDSHLAIVQTLIESGADPDHKNRYGRTARESATLRDQVVAALFEYGQEGSGTP